jgi:hypothetical protein
MRLYASFALVLFITGSLSIKAPPDTLWTKIFGGDNQGGCNNTGDVGRAIENSDDGGFVISGWTNSFGIDNTDVWLVSTDAQGNEIWSHAVTVNDTADEAVYDMHKTGDGGFILTGITEIVYCPGFHGADYACGGKVLLVRINELGDTLWTRHYDPGDLGWSEGMAVQHTTDGGFVVVGRTEIEDKGSDIWMAVTDGKGNIIWTRSYGADGYDAGQSVQQTDDGGFIITGVTESLEEERQKLWLIRTNELGDTLWTRRYLAGDWTEGRCVLQTDDGGFLVIGAVESWEAGIVTNSLLPPHLKDFLKKNIKEQEITGFTEKSILFEALEIKNTFQKTMPGLKISSKTRREIDRYKSILSKDLIIEGRDAWLLRTNEIGDQLWTRVFGGSGWDDIQALSALNDGGFILAGNRYNEYNESEDIWLIRINEMGDILWTTTLGDGAHEVAYDVRQTADNGYIVAAMKHNRELGVDQTWLIRYADEISSITKPDKQLPEKFVLEQNFPNPFNLTTSIRYQLPLTVDVELTVYTLLGQKVATLVSETQPAGSYQVTWRGTDQFGEHVSSGIYLYKLETATDVQVKKMILIK